MREPMNEIPEEVMQIAAAIGHAAEKAHRKSRTTDEDETMEQIELSGAELVFAQRMLPHFMDGKSVEDAARAVLDDDVRLFEAFCDRRHSLFFPTADERGRSIMSNEGTGDVIASEITRTVYERLRAS